MPGRAKWNTPRSGTQQRFFFFELACVAENEPTTVAAMKSSTKIFTLAGALLLTLAFAYCSHARAGKGIHQSGPKQHWKARTQPRWSLSFTHKAQIPELWSFTK